MSGPLSRTLGESALALALAAAFSRLLPLAGDDPFRSSLVILPLLVAALRALERRARELGGRTIRPAAGRIEGVLLAALVVLTLGRHRLGLVATDWFLAAGYLLLLAHRLARLVVGWRRCLGARLPQRPPAIFFFLPLVTYLALQPWMSEHRQPDGDEPFYLLLTHSLVYDFDADLTNNYTDGDSRRFMTRAVEPQFGDPVGPRGEILSRHTLLLPLVLAPAYRLAGRWGAMAMMAALTALVAWMVLRLGRYYAPHQPGAVLLAYGLAAFTPPLLVYSYQIWIEVPAALLVTLVLDRILALRHRRPWRLLDLLTLVVPLALLPLLKLRLALLALPLLALAGLRARPSRKAMAQVSGALAAALGALFLYYAVRFGNPLKMHHLSELVALESPLDVLRGAVGMFYDAAFGLFLPSPIWLLLLPALWLAVKRRSPQLLDFALVSLPYLVLIWPRSEWYGGWSPPFRYPLALLPLLALLLVPVLALRARRGVSALTAALGGLTLVLTLVWIVLPGWTYNFADGQTLLLDHAGARLGTDLGRFFPSAVRPRPATWIWPLASLLLVPLALGFRRRRSCAAPQLVGIVALLLVAAVLALAAGRWPTRVIEFEDGYVAKDRGRVTPPLWVVHRPSYQSGWALPLGGRLAAPVVAGGKRVTVRLMARAVGTETPRPLRLLAGAAALASPPVGQEWRQLELGPFDWPAGERLVILGPEGPRGDPAQFIVDRAELVWDPDPGGEPPT